MDTVVVETTRFNIITVHAWLFTIRIRARNSTLGVYKPPWYYEKIRLVWFDRWIDFLSNVVIFINCWSWKCMELPSLILSTNLPTSSSLKMSVSRSLTNSVQPLLLFWVRNNNTASTINSIGINEPLPNRIGTQLSPIYDVLPGICSLIFLMRP